MGCSSCNAYRVTVAVGICGIIAVIFGGIVGWVIVPMVIRDQIASTIPLRENSESWKRWLDPPVPITFRVYVFDVENPDEVLNGGIPRVKEYGPFVYNERRKKEILSVNETTSRVLYRQRFFFDFNKTASGNLTDDRLVTVPNLQALGVSQVMNNLKSMSWSLSLLNSAIPKLWSTAAPNYVFQKVAVKDLLFGQLPMYCNETGFEVKAICLSIRKFKPRTLTFDDGAQDFHTFSMFRYKNGSFDGIYELDLGINDVTQIGNIISWNNKTLMSEWKAESCNRILGTDSSIFRPYLTMDGVDSLHVFNTDACRSFKLTQEGDSDYKGVPSLRYSINEREFASTIENHENYCYCPQSIIDLTHSGGCLKSGIIELSSCHRVPIIISHPHFLMADEFYRKTEGLNPNKSKHQTYLNLEPYTGYPLSGASRMQINILLQSLKEVDVMKKLPNVLLPVLWIEEKFKLTDELIDEMDAKLLKNLLIVDVVRWLIIGIGSTMALSAASYYFTKIRTSTITIKE